MCAVGLSSGTETSVHFSACSLRKKEKHWFIFFGNIQGCRVEKSLIFLSFFVLSNPLTARSHLKARNALSAGGDVAGDAVPQVWGQGYPSETCLPGSCSGFCLEENLQSPDLYSYQFQETNFMLAGNQIIRDGGEA